MEDLRESHLFVKSEPYDPELDRFKFNIRLSFGANEYEANLNKIKGFGVDPSTNVLVLSHEFTTEEAAQEAVTKITDFYDNILPQLGPIPQVWETPKAQGKLFLATFRIPEAFAGQMAMIEPIVEALGEITSTDQHVELDVSGYTPAKEVISNPDAPLDPSLKVGSTVKFAIVTHKDLPNKLAAIATGMGITDPQTTTVATFFSSLKHVRFDIGYEEKPQIDKDSIKNQLTTTCNILYEKLAPLGLLDIMKAMGTTVKATMCIAPVISFDLTVYSSDFIDVLNKVPPPNP